MNAKQERLEELYKKHRNNPDSPLIVDNNPRIIFGEGSSDAAVMFVGEAPGRDEDIQGRPFVGRSGQLLNKTLEKCGIARSDVFITNIVKTRPTNNRTPNEQEMKRSLPLLLEQIGIIKPTIICTLGACAAAALLQKPISITKLHGYAVPFGNCIIVPTYHPAYILRDPNSYQYFLADIEFAIQMAKKAQKQTAI